MCKQEVYDEKKEMQKKLELQLHEQYSINNNSNLSSALILFVAMLAVVGAYGYVYLHSDCEMMWEWTPLMIDKDTYSAKALLLTATATILVLELIVYLCISFGCRQRREQFIIYAIRRKYYDKKEYKDVFPERYNPFGKENLEIVQSPYDKFIRCVFVVAFFIVVTTVFKITGICLLHALGSVTVVALGIVLLYKSYNAERKKIRKLEKYYLNF